MQQFAVHIDIPDPVVLVIRKIRFPDGFRGFAGEIRHHKAEIAIIRSRIDKICHFRIDPVGDKPGPLPVSVNRRIPDVIGKRNIPQDCFPVCGDQIGAGIQHGRERKMRIPAALKRLIQLFQVRADIGRLVASAVIPVIFVEKLNRVDIGGFGAVDCFLRVSRIDDDSIEPQCCAG